MACNCSPPSFGNPFDTFGSAMGFDLSGGSGMAGPTYVGTSGSLGGLSGSTALTGSTYLGSTPSFGAGTGGPGATAGFGLGSGLNIGVSGGSFGTGAGSTVEVGGLLLQIAEVLQRLSAGSGVGAVAGSGAGFSGGLGSTGSFGTGSYGSGSGGLALGGGSFGGLGGFPTPMSGAFGSTIGGFGTAGSNIPSFTRGPISSPIFESAPQNIPVTSFPVTSTSYDFRSSPSSFQSVSYGPCQPLPKPACTPVYLPAPAPQKEVEIRTVEVGQEKVQACQEEMNNMRHQLNLAEDTQERLRRQLQEAQMKLKVWAQKEGQAAQLEAEIARLKDQIFQADLKLVNSEGQRAGAAEQVLKLEREMQMLQGQLQKAGHLAGELEMLQGQLKEAQRRIVAAEGESSRYQTGMSHLEAQLGESQDRLFQLKNGFETERATMRGQLEEFMQKLQMAESQRDEAAKQCHFFEMKMKELEQRLMSGDQTTTQMQAQWEFERVQLREQLENAQHQIATLEKQRQECGQKVATLEAKLREAESRLAAAQTTIQSLEARIRQLEVELTNLRARLNAKVDLKSSTSTRETYKVATFEIAHKLAVMDGTDDGMYNDLPIEVEGEGLYKDLVARGRKPRFDGMTASSGSMTSSTQTYKVNSYDMAERLSKMDGTDDGMYNDLPIEVVGQGMYLDLRRQRGGGGGGFSTTTVSGGAAGGSLTGYTAVGGGGGSVTTTGGETYIVNSMDIAASLSKMGPANDGTYKGLPIEVKGMGLYRDLRAK